MIEISGILVLGFFAQWLAWRVKVPAILPLIIIGLMIGPLSSIILGEGNKFIDGDMIFQGDMLFDVVGLSVGLILFEGGLTLKIKEIKTLAHTVRNLIIVGTVVTLIGGGIALHYIMGYSWHISFLFGALIVVSGPTVIGPILRNVRANNNIATILKWEGILIDPVGALAAILIYEFIISGQADQYFTLFALQGFMITVLVGLIVGSLSASLIYLLLRRQMIPHYLRNTIILGIVILTFGLSDMLHEESGLLAVTISGMIIGNTRLEELKHILSFKEDVTIILISFLFVMLSSRIDMADLYSLLNIKILMLFLIIVFILRPIVVFISTYNSTLTWRERLFIAYICPRGIVAAAVASLFSVKLSDGSFQGIISAEQAEEAKMLLPLTFMTIVGTVVQQGLTAKKVVELLGVGRVTPNGILFLGANETARYLAKFLHSKGIPVMLCDTSAYNIREARNLLLPVYEGSILNDKALEEIDFSQYGQMYATTSNSDINMMATRMIGREIGSHNTYRLITNAEQKKVGPAPANVLFGGQYDFIGITQFIRTRPTFVEKKVQNNQEFIELLQKKSVKVPLFLISSNQAVTPISQLEPMQQEIQEGDTVVYFAVE
ncbi:cation:proton antiporter [Algivirga pacifica]|uniref:Sodium:proton antiporter n=1 Tax=Algivirga pacifica TaxID=1162670 RepID=A0ABP9DK30_9BACT